MADIKAAAAAYGNAANIMSPDASFAGGTSQTQNVGPDFAEFLTKSLSDTAESLEHSEARTVSQLAGKTTLDDVAMSLTNAELSIKTLLGIRDRVISAYQDIIKMSI